MPTIFNLGLNIFCVDSLLKLLPSVVLTTWCSVDVSLDTLRKNLINFFELDYSIP
jgi:hypothetical protein